VNTLSGVYYCVRSQTGQFKTVYANSTE